jgi:hypothetical protein
MAVVAEMFEVGPEPSLFTVILLLHFPQLVIYET